MKTESASRFGYSEKEMADAFQSILNSPDGLADIGPFDGVYREVLCRQGCPDFIAIRNIGDNKFIGSSESNGLVGPSILSLLKRKSSHTLRYIVNHSEFSENSIEKSLRKLIAAGYIDHRKVDSYRLGSTFDNLKTELWAFELKLDNPKRAVFQAQQCRAYADRVIIVVPPGQEKNYTRFSNVLKRWHIGLVTFNPINKEINLLRRGRITHWYNQQDRIYTMFQLSMVRGQ